MVKPTDPLRRFRYLRKVVSRKRWRACLGMRIRKRCQENCVKQEPPPRLVHYRQMKSGMSTWSPELWQQSKQEASCPYRIQCETSIDSSIVFRIFQSDISSFALSKILRGIVCRQFLQLRKEISTIVISRLGTFHRSELPGQCFSLSSLRLGTVFLSRSIDKTSGEIALDLCVAFGKIDLDLHSCIYAIGAIADPESMNAFLDLVEATLLNAGQCECTLTRIDIQENTTLRSLHADAAPWKPTKEDCHAQELFFPFDVFTPGPDMYPWLLTFLPEAMHALWRISGKSATPPFPWGQHFYIQLFLTHCSHLEGDLAEFGVGLGGASLLFARLAQDYGKQVLCIDSFEGLPEPRPEVDNSYFVKGDYAPHAKDGAVQDLNNWAAHEGVLSAMVVVKSFFSELQTLSSEKLCFVHLDSDLYDSVWQSLVLAYDLVVPGGIIVIDDFFHHAQGPARAVSDFFRLHNRAAPILHPIPPYAVAIQKGYDLKDLRGQHAKRSLDGNFYSFQWMRASDAFQSAVEASRCRLLQRLSDRTKFNTSEEEFARLLRCLRNAERFLIFLRGSDADTPCCRGAEIFEYLACLESWLDSFQGSREDCPGQRVAQMI